MSVVSRNATLRPVMGSPGQYFAPSPPINSSRSHGYHTTLDALTVLYYSIDNPAIFSLISGTPAPKAEHDKAAGLPPVWPRIKINYKDDKSSVVMYSAQGNDITAGEGPNALLPD